MKTPPNRPATVRASWRAVILFLSLLLVPPLQAQLTTNTWDGGGAGSSWGTASNWVGDVVPTFNTNAILVFNTNVGSADTLFLGAQRQINGIIFGANLTGGADNVFDIQTRTAVNGATAANLLFNGGATNASITLDANTILSRIRLGAGGVGAISLQTTTDLFHNASSVVLQFDANTTGAGSLNKHGVGTVTFTRVNSYNGLNLYGGGAVVWNQATALGTNSVTLGETGSSSNVSLFLGSGLNYTNAITVSSGSGTRLIGNTDGTSQLGFGAITGNAILSGGIDLAAGKDVTFAITNYNATTDRMSVSGAVTGTGGIVKTGAGILILNGAGNDYSGTTDIQGGKLFLGSAGRLGSGAVTISNGAILDFGTGVLQTNIVANNISGAGSILQSTASTDTRLTGDVTSTGGLTINNGTLRIGNGGTTGSYTGDTVVESGAALVFARSDAYTHGGEISGAGNVTKVNAGDVTLTASNSYSGNTTLFDGALVADDANALGTGNIIFSGNTGTIRYTAASAGTDWASRITNSTGTVRLDTDGNNVNLSGIIDTSNVAGLVKSGTGTLTLGGANTYTGSTTVANGRLVVNGSITNSTVTVATNATLAGSGTLGGLIVSSGGTINPGNSPGTLSVTGNAVWNAGGNYNWQIHDATGTAGDPTGWDLLSVSGTLNLADLSVGNEFKINLWSLSGTAPDANGNALNFNPAENRTWTIATALGGISGYTGTNQFLINIGATNGAGGFANPLNDGTFSVLQSGNNLNLVFNSAAPIPEPGTWAAAALLAAGATFARWRKRVRTP